MFYATGLRASFRSDMGGDPDFDVVVVGCGPVGAFAANLLANYGLRVLVLEKDSGMYAAPRAVAMDDETVRLFGLIDPSLASWLNDHLYQAPINLRTGPPPEAVKCLPPRGAGRGVDYDASGFHSGWSLVGPLPPRMIEESGGYAEFAFHHQPTLERRLRERLTRCGDTVTLKLGQEVTSVSQPESSPAEANSGSGKASRKRLPTSKNNSSSGKFASVTSIDLSTGKPHVYTCHLILACDGGSSHVRKSLGIPFEGSSFRDEPWMVIDVESDDPAIAAAYPHFNFMNAWDPRIGKQRCVVHVPLPGPRAARRFEFLLEHGEDPAAMVTPASQAALLATVGIHASRVSVVRSLVYTFHARQAERWRQGRVLMMGDAAQCVGLLQ